MKIRTAFVSNSSSSSYVVLFPKNFDINSIDISSFQQRNYFDGSDEEVMEKLREAYNQLISNGEVYQYDNYQLFDVLSSLFTEEPYRGYVIGGFETGPDGGSISLADMDKVREILGIEACDDRIQE